MRALLIKSRIQLVSMMIFMVSIVGAPMCMAQLAAAGNVRKMTLFRGATDPAMGTFTDICDTMLASGSNEDLNYGASKSLAVGFDGNDERVTAVWFASWRMKKYIQKVVSAKLILHCSGGTAGTKSILLAHNQRMGKWTEGNGEGTFELMAPSWRYPITPYGGWSGSRFDEKNPFARTTVVSTTVEIPIPVELVEEWLRDDDWHGVVIHGVKGSPMLSVASSEADKALRPRIEIEYVPAPAVPETKSGDAGGMQKISLANSPDDIFHKNLFKNPWHGHLVDTSAKIQPEIVSDYATVVYGKPWNFTNGDRCRITTIGPGILSPKFGNGSLSFTSGKEGAYFGWGNPLDPLLHDRKKSTNQFECFNRTFEGGAGGLKWAVRLHMRQPLGKSQWKLCASQGWGALEVFTNANGDRDLSFDCGRTGPSYENLLVQCLTPGIAVDIQSVEIGLLSSPVVFQKKINLDADPVEGRVCIIAGEDWQIFINGKKAGGKKGRALRSFYSEIDIASSLSRGENTLQIKANRIMATAENGYYIGMLMEGEIRLKNGEIILLASDKTWTAASSGHPAESEFQPVIDYGDPETLRLTMRSFDPEKRYTKDPWKIIAEPPYYGPIGIVTNSPGGQLYRLRPQSENDFVFDCDLSVPNPAGMSTPSKIAWELLDGSDWKMITSGTQESGQFDGSQSCELFRITPHVKGPKGYILSLKLIRNGKEIASRMAEIVAVGEIKQTRAQTTDEYDSIMKPVLVDEINFSKGMPPRPFMDGMELGNSIIVTDALGSYLETGLGVGGGTSGNWASVEYRVLHPHRPHLLRAEVPQDARRSTEIRILGPSSSPKLTWSAVEGVSAQDSGYPIPLAAGDVPVEIVFWPTATNGTVSVVNVSKLTKYRAACRRIRIYEITGDIPAINVRNESGRLIGTHTERWNILLPFMSTLSADQRMLLDYNFTGGLYHWNEAIANLVRLMRMRGENYLNAGVYMYSMPVFPTIKPTRGTFSRMYEGMPILDLMAMTFEENKLSLSLGIELCGGYAVEYFGHLPTVQEIAAGEDTPQQVGSDGRPISAYPGPLLNPVHPKTLAIIKGLIEELAARYGRYASVRGVTFYSSDFGLQPIWGGPDHASYDDYSIAQFQRDTGVVIPESSGGAERFAKRAKWLASHQEPWQEWRCRMLAQFTRNVAAMVESANPHWTCSVVPSPLVYGFNSEKLWKLFDDIESRGEKPSFLSQYKERGIDITQWQATNRLVVFANSDGERTCDTLDFDGGQMRGRDRIEAMRYDLELRQVYEAAGIKGSFLGPAFNEEHLRIPKDKIDQWYFNDNLTCSISFPPGDAARETFCKEMAFSLPEYILYAYSDCNIFTGMERYLAPFMQAYRNLPIGHYENVAGGGFERAVTIRQTKSGKGTTAMLANLGWWRATVTCSAKAELVNRVTGAVMPPTFSIGPYSVMAIDVNDDSGIVRAESSIAAADTAHFQKCISAARSALPLGKDSGYDNALAQAAALIASGDIEHAWRTLLGRDIARFFNVCSVRKE